MDPKHRDDHSYAKDIPAGAVLLAGAWLAACLGLCGWGVAVAGAEVRAVWGMEKQLTEIFTSTQVSRQDQSRVREVLFSDKENCESVRTALQPVCEAARPAVETYKNHRFGDF